MSYRIKQVPEDFIVIEKPSLALVEGGKYAYFTVRKKGYTTLRAVHMIARVLGIEYKRVGYCGSKDKQAVTEQAFSINDMPKERLAGLRLPGVEINFIGRGERPLRLGELEKNHFRIIIREIQNLPTPISRYVNYYGSQRFGRHNAAVGRALVRRRYVEAITLICESSDEYADQLHTFIGEHPNNPIGALRLLPKTLLMLYVHAYQAILWNETVERYLEERGSALSAPLIGFGTQASDPLINKIVEDILTREGLTPRDFVFRDMPELCAEGGERAIFVDVPNLVVGRLEDNELGPGKKSCVEFSLPPGSYATVFIDQLFSAAL